VGQQDLCEFELVPVSYGSVISSDEWGRIQRLLLEMQPARTASLVGEPPRAITVVGRGGTEVAQGQLNQVTELAGTSLRVVPG
jgi:hypothetical protein